MEMVVFNCNEKSCSNTNDCFSRCMFVWTNTERINKHRHSHQPSTFTQTHTYTHTHTHSVPLNLFIFVSIFGMNTGIFLLMFYVVRRKDRQGKLQRRHKWRCDEEWKSNRRALLPSSIYSVVGRISQTHGTKTIQVLRTIASFEYVLSSLKVIGWVVNRNTDADA